MSDTKTDIKKFSQFTRVDEGPVDVVGLQSGQNVIAKLTTDLVETNPDVTFRDAKGRFRSIEDYDELTDQLKVNRFIANELDAINEAVDTIQEKGYDDTEIRELIKEEESAREGADAALSDLIAKEAEEREDADQILEDRIEKEEVARQLADIGLRDALQEQIDTISEKGYDDTEIRQEISDLNEKVDGIEFPETDLTPVTDRLDNIEEVLPKVPVIIEPVDIGQQVCEITESRPTGASGKAGSVLIWKTETGGPANPFNECKLVCPDVSAIVLGVRTIWWKQGDRVQRWDMSGGGWFTNGNVLHYSAVETSGDELVDGEPIELYYVDPKSTSDDLLDVISRMESKADDRKLQAEIEELALIVGDAINAVQRDHGAWVYMGDGNTIPRNAGEFTLLTNNLSSPDNVVTLNTTDADGKLHGFNADIEAGEYLEIVDEDDPNDYVLFVLTMAPSTNGNLTEFRVALKKASRSFDVGDRCQVRIIHLDETSVDLSELDDRYLKRTGGMMLGNIDMEQNQIYDAASIQSKEIRSPSLDSGQNSNLVIGRNGESRLVIASDSVVAQEPLRLTKEGVNQDHAVTKKYVDEASSEAVKKAERNEIAEGQFQMVWIDDDPGLPFQGRIGYQSSVTDPNAMEGSFLFADGINQTTGNTAILSIGRDGDLELHGDNAIRGIGHGSQNWRPIIEGFYSIEAEKIFVNGKEITEPDLSGYVSKIGGDDMQGPLHVKGWGNDSRGTARVKTLGVFSDSSSALRLGTTTDRVYIEDQTTKFNGSISVDELGPKNEGKGVTLLEEGTQDDHLVTKGYVDNKASGSSFTAGQQVAKRDNATVEVGGFYTLNGALYFRMQ